MSNLTPHGPGFSFIDQCEVDKVKKRAHGTKLLDPNSPFFADHFPGKPTMPGVLLVESAAQTAGVLWQSLHPRPDLAVSLAQVQFFRFLKVVSPGQILKIDVTLEKDFDSLAQFDATIKVDSVEVAVGKITLSRRLV